MSIGSSLGKILSCLVLLSVGACGGDDNMSDAVSALSAHYAANPPNRKWELISITPDPRAKRIDVAVNVTSESDLWYIKSLSRMEQFAAAKLACPFLTPELIAALGANTRVWTHLNGENKEITASICPAR